MRTYSIVQLHSNNKLETLSTFVDKEDAYMAGLQRLTGSSDLRSYLTYEEAFTEIRKSLGQKYNAHQFFMVESNVTLT